MLGQERYPIHRIVVLHIKSGWEKIRLAQYIFELNVLFYALKQAYPIFKIHHLGL